MWTLNNHYYSLPCIVISLFAILPIQKASSSDGILKTMNAECIKEGIKVHLVFQKPFEGVAYSFGHYDNAKCRYISGPDSQFPISTNYSFLIPKNDCGTKFYDGAKNAGINSRRSRNTEQSLQNFRSSNTMNANDMYIENTLLIQQDTSIQEEGDLAQKIRCVWQSEIHKPLVASLPFFDRRNEPPKFTLPSRNNTTINNYSSSNNGVRVRFESKKGSVENVPHSYYNFRRKFQRSLNENMDKSNVPEALPLTSSSNSINLKQLVTIPILVLALLSLFNMSR